MELTNNFELQQCKNKIPYEISHEKIPIKLDKNLDEAIKYLLRYVPNINSEQARSEDMLTNKEYDDYVFEELMALMRLRDIDVLFTDSIEKFIADDFKEGICLNDQKIVMTLADGETKAMSLLRHIRNAIAHGNFNVVEGLLIGFDIKRLADEKIEYRGIFKIKPEGLLKALRRILFDLSSQEFISEAFRKAGYWVEPYQEKYQRSHRFDLFAKKKSKLFAIEIRNYRQSRQLSEKEIEKILSNFGEVQEGLIPILIINSSYLTKSSKEKLLDRDVIILDIKNIKKMHGGRDMVAEILRDSLIFKNKLK
ncbi:hypothetical protein [uncultured Anaerococcus sp.]|uniref:hypothetical protein n=1 Tax=uncultured Anaerococcus sp. TaxID=293428 RepID=UPI0025F591DB|nr:hypothetical protein [uncultured Anaerococcus sp.]